MDKEGLQTLIATVLLIVIAIFCFIKLEDRNAKKEDINKLEMRIKVLEAKHKIERRQRSNRGSNMVMPQRERK